MKKKNNKMNLLYKIHKNEYDQQKENVVRSVLDSLKQIGRDARIDVPMYAYRKGDEYRLVCLTKKKNQRNSNETNKNLGAAMNEQ